ncbi:hypothetical protein T09_1166 [Trichinella sp. T9]|nr:hypothetical protein T09_1166 [Trichinella sp. T9]
MPLCALICRFRSVRFKPIRKFDGHLVKIYRRPKRATQLTRLMLLHCAQTIINRWYLYSYRFSPLTQSPQPAQNEALLHYFRTTMTEERLNRFAAMCTFILTFPLILTLLTFLLADAGI